jgi:threonyl-tRNA synthetase
VRCRIDARSESVGKKIRDAELAKLPYMLVVGDREESDNTVSVRAHGEQSARAQEASAFAAELAGAS